jgi:hypothetical protein
MLNTRDSIKLLLFSLSIFLLTAFAGTGFFLMDVAYQSVSSLRNEKIRNEAIHSEFPELIHDSKDIVGNLRARNFQVKTAGFRVIKNGREIAIPSSGQQSNFDRNIKKVMRRSMTPNRIKETDLFGRFYIRAPDGGRVAGYYSSLNALRPLLDSGEWKESVTGYYLNVAGDLDAVRLSYFTTSPDQTRQIVEGFVADHGLEYIRSPSVPVLKRISGRYGGEELRFRKFLATYTQIGLDLLDYDITYARRLVAEYRLSYSPQRLSCRPLFEPALIKHSPYYNSLESQAKSQLWQDFNYWHPGGDWLHMMVNMLLPGDWLYIPEFKPFFLGDNRPPITPDQRQAMLAVFNLDIPPDWRP